MEGEALSSASSVTSPVTSSPSSPFQEMLGDINSFGTQKTPDATFDYSADAPWRSNGRATPTWNPTAGLTAGSTAGSTRNINPNHSITALTDTERRDSQRELDKIEEEIKTLRQVLQVKIRRSLELKKQLGHTPFQELHTTLKTIQESDAYQKTTTSLKTATLKTGFALSLAGSSVKTRLGDLKKSSSIQSLQERMNTTYNKIAGKSYSRMPSSQSAHNFGDIGGGKRPDSLWVDNVFESSSPDYFQSASVPTTPTMTSM